MPTRLGSKTHSAFFVGNKKVLKIMRNGLVAWAIPLAAVATLPLRSALSNDFPVGTVPGSTATGQPWNIFSGPASMKSYGFDSDEGTGASYLEANTEFTEITRIGARFQFSTVGGTRNGNGCTFAIGSWADGGIFSNGFGRRTRCHVTITPNAVQWYVRTVEGPQSGNDVVLISTKTLNPPLAKDVPHTVEVLMSGTTGTVRINGNRDFVWTDSRIAHRAGETFVFYEPYYNSDGTDSRVGVLDTWANGVLPVLPTGPYAAWTGDSVNNTASTTGSIKLPRIYDGDLILLASVIAQQSATITPSGLAFSSITPNTRAGITLCLWSKIGQVSDSGKTIGLTFSHNLANVSSVLILRNVLSRGTPVGRNLGSGQTTATVEPFTPSSTVIPVHLIGLTRSAGAASTPVPPTGITRYGGPDPTSGRVSGLAWGYNLTKGQAVGNVWTNPQGHIQATYLIPINVAA
jgi:hypothetical protein